jgi:hypothetical protein
MCAILGLPYRRAARGGEQGHRAAGGARLQPGGQLGAAVSNTGESVPMSREGVDHALAQRRDERDRISAALLDLENQQGYQLLEGAALSGPTRGRWEEAQAQVTALWQVFDAYARVLDEAEQLRRRSTRPGQGVLAELTRLLGGESVELAKGEIPLEQRTLLDPPAERLSLDAAVDRMKSAYDRAREAIAPVDDAWTALLPALGEAEDAWRAVHALSQALEEDSDPALDRIGRELAEARGVICADPLSLVRADGQADTQRLEAIRAELAERRSGLEEADRLRGGHDERIQRIEAILGQVEETTAKARQARDVVLVKIVSPGLPDIHDPAPALRERLAALGTLRGQGRWAALAARVDELETAAAAALDQARGTLHTIEGLLDRRAELRGRLEAYTAKAARLGHAEDAELVRLQEQAKSMLWAAPCDLRQATVVLAAYQHAVNFLETPTAAQTTTQAATQTGTDT